MKYFLCRFVPPGPDFLKTLTPEQKQLMKAHGEFLQAMLEQGGVVAHLLGERRIDQDNIVVVQCLHGQGQNAVILIIADVLLEKRAAAVIRLPGNLEDLLGEDDERVLVEVDNVL